MKKNSLAPYAFLGVFLAGACTQIESGEESKKDVKAEATASLAKCPPCPCAQEVKKLQEPDPKYCPEVSMLGHLAETYEVVKFDHKAHVDYAPSCSACHHQQTEVEKAPPCRECHTLAFKTLGKPGLKGAYHRQCMNCHLEKGAPMGCTDCHKEAKKPSRLEIPPKVAVLSHLTAEFEPVKFDHESHEHVTDECADCHHHQGDIEKTPPCRECHNTIESKEGEKKVGLKDAYHKQCGICHGEKSKMPLACTGCHLQKGQAPEPAKGEGAAPGGVVPAKDVAPITAAIPADRESMKLKWKAATMPPVKFKHLKHSKDYAIGCLECHHMGGSDLTCSSCHKGTKGPAGEPTYKTVMHKNCIGCHKGKGGPKGCMDCHK